MAKYLILLIIIPALIYLSMSGCRAQAGPGEKLSSELLQLATSKEPGKFAKEHGMTLINGTIKVIIAVKSGISDLDDFAGEIRRYGLKEVMINKDLITANVPVVYLVSLSEEKYVKHIRRPRKFWKM